MRVLMTGAGGFVGRHFRQFLLEQGVCVSTLSLRRADGRSRADWLLDDAGDVGRVVEQAAPDLVLHLAGTTACACAQTLDRINVGFAKALLGALRERGASCPFVAFGSAAEYGDVPPASLPVREGHPCQPSRAYGRSKLAQTRLVLAACGEGASGVVVRPFNIIGPGMPESLLLPGLIRNIAAAAAGPGPRVPLALRNPDATRDFVDVRDVVPLVWEIARNPQSAGRIVNVCGGRETSVARMFQAVARELGADVTFRAQAAQQGEITRSVGSTALMWQLSGRLARIPLEESVRDAVRARAR